jgi:hypothetical protein
LPFGLRDEYDIRSAARLEKLPESPGIRKILGQSAARRSNLRKNHEREFGSE